MLVNDAGLRDSLITHLENIVTNVEEVIQLLPVGHSNDVDHLQNYRRSLEYYHYFLSTLRTSSDSPSALASD